jgi:hypothetical protein
VEDQEEPLAPIIFKSMLVSPRIAQLERNRRLTNHVFHHVIPPLRPGVIHQLPPRHVTRIRTAAAMLPIMLATMLSDVFRCPPRYDVGSFV